jgi:EAL domain-containing protein (putative c-di-GMP-specific phosphodiesterase class I)
MNKADSKAIVEHLISITSKEAHYLMRTAARLDALRIDISWVKSLDESDENSEMLDAFVSRFSRLQDTLGG